MKKNLKSILTVILAMALLILSAVSADAATGYNTNDGTDDTNPLSDTTSFTFTKHYELVGDTTDGSSPAEDFTVTFTPYAVANIPASAAITTANMPTISDATLSAAAGAADTGASTNVTATVDLPTYTAVGDYWYKVNETAGFTAGVTYDNSDYYLHVQVLHAAEDSDDLIRLVTLHETAPNADGTPTATGDTKNDGIENRYSNGSLSLKKTVKGNMGDLTKEYQVTVAFAYASADDTNCPVKSAISYTDGTAKTVSGWAYDDEAWKATVTLSLSHNETVKFTNIPYGVTYTVTETDYSSEGYTHSLAFTSADSADTVTAEGTDDWNAAKATGTIADAEDELIVTNEKKTDIDVGVLVENAPFIAVILLVLAAGIVFVITLRKRRNTIA